MMRNSRLVVIISINSDENAEEGLTSCNVQQGQNKNFGSKKSHFHFKNRELFLQNIELKKIDSQSRLLLRQITWCLANFVYCQG